MAKNRVIKLKYFQKILTGIHVFLDFLAICLSFYLAYISWDILGPFLSVDMYEKVEIGRYSLLFGVSLITLLMGFEVNDLYHPQRSMLNIKEFQAVFKTWMMACGVTMVILFLADELIFSRGIFITTWIYIIVLLLVERYAFFKFNLKLSSVGVVSTHVLIYGSGIMAKQLTDKFKRSPKLGYHISGYIADESEILPPAVSPILGKFDGLKSIIHKTGADRLFIAVANLPAEKVMSILDICRNTGCKFQVVPSLLDLTMERVRLQDLEGIPLLALKELRLSKSQRTYKRTFDIFGSLFFLILFWPATLFMAVLCILSGGKMVFERITYIGRAKKNFYAYKFICASREKGPHYFNRFLKKSGLEKYPYLVSVLLGNMSLAGPEPVGPEALETRNELNAIKFNVKPGIMGMWNFSGARREVKFPDEDLDVFYIQNQSVFLDVLILLKSCGKFFHLFLRNPRRP